jgi:hypothetical protein
MKKTLAIVSSSLVSSLILLSAHAALAAGIVYEGRSFNPEEGDMDRCRITVNDEAKTLSIHFKSQGDSESDLVLQGSQITGISAGDFVRRPGFFSTLMGGSSQDRVQFMVEYVDEQGQAQSRRIDVPRDKSRYLEGDLEDLIGQRLSSGQ